MKPRILMIAFEFAPSNGASTQRIHAFYDAFVDAGWDVDVLTANPAVYENKSNDITPVLSENGHIIRTRAFDAQRDLAIGGKYISYTMTPDRYGLTWIPTSLFKIEQHIKQYKPDIIWSSAPIPSVHFIAQKLANKHHISWVADYRDPMPYLHRPASNYLNNIHQKIDRKTMETSKALTFATQETALTYQQHFRQFGLDLSDKITIIENGYNEKNFQQLPENIQSYTIFDKQQFNIYYSGALYPNGRDPEPIFKTLKTLIEQPDNIWTYDNLRLYFQGPIEPNDFKSLLEQYGLTQVVVFLPSVSFIESLINMMNADLLLIIQDEKFNRQVPGKLFEYLRTQKAIWLKTPEDSATYQIAKAYDGVYFGYDLNSLNHSLDIILSQKKELVYIRDTKTHNRVEKSKKLVTICENLITKQKDTLL